MAWMARRDALTCSRQRNGDYFFVTQGDQSINGVAEKSPKRKEDEDAKTKSHLIIE
jgi:hypothetical protein